VPVALVRGEVREETGLVVRDADYLLDMPYPSGMTSVFVVSVEEGEPVLGPDDGSGPEPIALAWVPAWAAEDDAVAVPPLLLTVRRRSAMK
jgi:8-oxo-dGTP diphosphatase